jgi:hypothetical protein
VRLADRVLNQGVTSVNPHMGEAHQAEVAQAVHDQVELATIIEATNVYRYCKDSSAAVGLYDLPCGAPPENLLWVEYDQDNRYQAGMTALAHQGPFNLSGTTPEPEVGDNGYRKLRSRNGSRLLWLSDLLPDEPAWKAVRWLWQIFLFQGAKGKVFGPLSSMAAALDEGGALIDATYQSHIDGISHEQLETFTLFPMQIFLTTVNFMQCANIRTVYVNPPEKLSRKHMRQGHINQPLVRYHVLKLVAGPAERARSQGGDGTGLVGFHPVRGGFHHYGNCCPGRHPPKGLYFGKGTGRYWVPAHAAGNPNRAVITRDFAIGDDLPDL